MQVGERLRAGEKGTTSAHRLAHRDGFIAGTGATGFEPAGGI